MIKRSVSTKLVIAFALFAFFSGSTVAAMAAWISVGVVKGKLGLFEGFGLFSLGSTVLLIVGGGLTLAVTRRITTPLRRLAEAAARIAAGELSIRLDRKGVDPGDEVGVLVAAFSEMAENLRNLVANVTSSAREVAETSSRLAAAAGALSRLNRQVSLAVEGLATGTGDQNKNVAEVANLIREVSQAVSQLAVGTQEQSAAISDTSHRAGHIADLAVQVAEGAGQALKASELTASEGRRGGETVAETIAGMERVKQTVFEAAAHIRELGSQSQSIGEIVRVIGDLAEQTNLLALNAAIEAARAGEHGRGFAVVADEVRKLAERSAKSAQEISALIVTILQGTEKAVAAMEIGTAEVEGGVTLARRSGEALGKIISMAEDTRERTEIISANGEQNRRLAEDIARSVESLAAIVQESSAATQQMAANGTQAEKAISGIAGISIKTATVAVECRRSLGEALESTQSVAGSAEALEGMAQNLRHLVAQFKLND